MKKIFLLLLVSIAAFSCNKDVSPKFGDITKTTTQPVSPPKSNNLASSKLIQGTSTDGCGNTSGVFGNTGLEPLEKHYVTLANGTLFWDGTYDFNWYGRYLNVTIATYANNATFGDPVYPGTFITDPNTNTTASAFQGYASNFTMPAGGFTVGYSCCALTIANHNASWNQQSNNGDGAWIIPGSNESWTIKSGGCVVVHDYGKLIKTNTGSGFAAAEVNWSPTPLPGSNTTWVKLKNTFPSTTAFPSSINIDFMQNGNVIQSNVFPNTAAGTSPVISILPGIYQLKFTAPSGFQNYEFGYFINPGGLGWPAGAGTNSDIITTGPVSLQGGNTYTISASTQ
jgi:hypothetical protein